MSDVPILGKKFRCPIPIPMFTTVKFGLFFAQCMCFVSFLIDVHLHAYANYTLQVNNIITAHVRPIWRHPPPNTKWNVHLEMMPQLNFTMGKLCFMESACLLMFHQKARITVM